MSYTRHKCHNTSQHPHNTSQHLTTPHSGARAGWSKHEIDGCHAQTHESSNVPSKKDREPSLALEYSANSMAVVGWAIMAFTFA